MTAKIMMVSLGCAKNLVNSEQMLWLLRQAGFELTADAEKAEVAVLNTCGFIDSAVSEAIDKILELAQYKKTGSLKKLLVAGCMTQRYKGQVLDEMPEVDGLIGCGSYEQIVSAVKSALDGETPKLFGNIDAPLTETPRIVSTPRYTAYIKIAEGCDNRCSYCVIPSLRGRYRSRRFEDIVAEAEELAASGVKELIVVAQDITRYGTDLYGRRRLAELTRALCAIDSLKWIRLHYLYPDELDEELIDTVASEPKVVKYLDIPIQHVNNRILKAMNRRGTKEEITALFYRMREKIPNLVLRTSLICGLPGEGEAEFEELVDFLQKMRLERVGVFPFSPQEGTPAAEMGGCADEDTVNRRVSIINDLQSEVMDEYNKSRINSVMTVLCEGVDAETGLYEGRSWADSPEIDGRVLFESEKSLSPGDMPDVLIERQQDGDLIGRAL